MMTLLFSKTMYGRKIDVRSDWEAKTISIESDGDTIALVRVDKSGDVIAYTPPTEEELGKRP